MRGERTVYRIMEETGLSHRPKRKPNEMKLVNDIRKQTAAGSEYTIIHIRNRFSFRFWKLS